MTIKELRTERKLTQAAFAKSIGVGLSTVGGYESGRTQPSQAVIDKIRQVYGVKIGTASKAAEKKAPAAKAAPAKKAAAKKARAKKNAGPQIIIQSPLGGEITPFAILARVGDVDKVYIRVDMNKLYWVRGNESGSMDIW